MITRIEVDGFKSLCDFAIDLEPFTVLIGPNSAGKSNVLDALALLSRLASSTVKDAFKHGRGRIIDQFNRHGGDIGDTLRFAVEVLVPARKIAPRSGVNRLRYELVIKREARGSGAERLLISSEQVKPLLRDADSWIQSHPELEPFTVYAERDDGNRRVPPFDQVLNGFATADADIGIDAESSTLRDELRRVRLLQPDTARLHEPSERIDADGFAPDASNLPTILADLPAALVGEIRADLVSVVPGLSSFDVVSEGDSFHIDFELSGGDRLPARIVSDGTLRVLALLTALRAEPRPSVLGVEEPENGIFPGRLRALLGLLREASVPAQVTTTDMAEDREAARSPLPTQILLTTHSPVVLAALRSEPQHLRFIDLVRRDGRLVTRARAVGRSTAPDRGRLTVSPREIDRMLNAVEIEAVSRPQQFSPP